VTIYYEEIVQEALRSVVKDVLKLVEKDGLPGQHHLYITFQTHYPGVEMADYLKERHPDEVTIVLQYQFWDLKVDTKGFYVTLSFNDIQEPIYVPYGAITGFVDPSVKFGLQFNPTELPEELPPAPKKTSKKGKAKAAEDPTGKVITLDTFRKK
jgi:uncharacterized protein